MNCLVGINAGFGELLGAADLAELRTLGVSLVRDEMRASATDDQVRAQIREFFDQPYYWLAILPNATSAKALADSAQRLVDLAREVEFPQDRLWIELGNELDLKMWSVWAENPAGYADCCAAAHRALREMDFEGPIISGGVSTTDTRGRTFLKGMHWETLPADLIAGVHRYSVQLDPQRAFPGFATRDQELDAVRACVSGHQLAHTEGGYHTSRVSLKNGWFKTTEKQLSDVEAAGCLVRELDFWAKQPDVVCCCLYQWNDGASANEADHYGLRYMDRTWKPQAVAVQEWAVAHKELA